MAYGDLNLTAAEIQERLNAVPNKAEKPVILINTIASLWSSDSTYSDYKYKCDIPCDEVTSDSYAEVIFNVTEAANGDYAPICSTGANIVTIYSKKNTQITIPTIIIHK